MTVVAAPRGGARRRERSRPQPQAGYRGAVSTPELQRPVDLDQLIARWPSVLDASDRALAAIELAGLLPAAEIHQRRQTLRDERHWLDQRPWR